MATWTPQAADSASSSSAATLDRARTRVAAESFAAALAARLHGDTAVSSPLSGSGDPSPAAEDPGASSIEVVDLANLGGAVIEGSPEVDAALATVRDATVLVVATPVYKAGYTGLLKAFLDRLAGGALAGVLAIPFTVAGSPIHRLVADVHLRPLLVELGATVPTRAFTVEEPDLNDLALSSTDGSTTTLASCGTWCRRRHGSKGRHGSEGPHGSKAR